MTISMFYNGGAQFSEDRVYRYALWRIWDEEKAHIMFIGLNPSTADEQNDDPTIRRCIGFARGWGYGGIYMLNLFAYRATNPKEMKEAADPVGPENDHFLEMYAESTGKIVAVWGSPGAYKGRGYDVNQMLAALEINVWCFGMTKNDEPRHPLYLPKSTELEVLP